MSKNRVPLLYYVWRNLAKCVERNEYSRQCWPWSTQTTKVSHCNRLTFKVAAANSLLFAPPIGGTSKLVALRATEFSVAGATSFYEYHSTIIVVISEYYCEYGKVPSTIDFFETSCCYSSPEKKYYSPPPPMKLSLQSTSCRVSYFKKYGMT